MIFYFSIYKDEIYAVRLAKQLNDIFPGVKVVVIADGHCYLPSIDAAIKFNPNLEFVQGDRLKNAANGGMKFTHRNFEEILKFDFDVAIKLDPDSYVWREPKYIPDADWFGNVFQQDLYFLGKKLQTIGGGAMGFKQSTVERLHSSKALLDTRYDSVETFYDRYRKFKKFSDPDNETGLVRSEDWTLAHVCDRLSIKPAQWDDVKCVQSQEQIYPGLDFCITHPCRTVW